MSDRRQHRKPLVLMILDGWGCRTDSEDNAIAQAHTPCWDRLWRQDPHALINTSGEAVGLPDGQMGNSEVGHMNIGAGRTVYQELTRITKSIQDGSFERNAAISEALDATIAANGSLHIMGLMSPGGVHSHEMHFLEAVRMAARKGVSKAVIHLFLDGRDTPPKSAEASIRMMQELVDKTESACIATICGRYFAMDRDKRWERIKKAYDAVALGQAEYHSGSALEALSEAYERGESDEFVQPTIVGPGHPVVDGDSVFFINFRADRARELSMAFVTEDFQGFERERIRLSSFVCMTEYLADLPAAVAFPSANLPHILAEILATNGLHQLRIAETEKYAHVTFFFNGGREEPYPLEDRVLIPSPKVATYDLQPEMSAPQLAKQLATNVLDGQYDVIICNVANPDMVGHTGSLNAAILAVEAVDRCLAAVVEAIDSVGGELLITADHGNVEQMRDVATGQAHTAHTTNPVPALFHGRKARMSETGSLRDIAPTMLHLLGLPQPAEMTGHSLLKLSDTA